MCNLKFNGTRLSKLMAVAIVAALFFCQRGKRFFGREEGFARERF